MNLKIRMPLIAYELCYALLYSISLLPMVILYRISLVIFFFSYHVVGYRRSVVIQNVARAFPDKKYNEIQAVVKRFYQHFASFLAENIKAISAPTEMLNRNLVFENLDIMDKHILAGRNVIACLGHCANWEVLNFISFNISSPVHAIYKPLKSPVADRLMQKIRSRFGVKLIPDRTVARHMLSKKSNPGIYLFLADQCPYVLDNQYKFNFLNQDTYFFSGMEKLARLDQSAVVYLHVTGGLSKGKYKIKCVPICSDAAAMEPGEITRRYVALLTENIKEEPHSWLWTHRRWKR